MRDNTKHPQNQSIRVALSHESTGSFKGWVAECLDFNLVAQGKTEEEAKQSFQRTLIGHISLAIQNSKNPFWSFIPESASPAPKKSICLSTDLRKMNIAFSQLERTNIVALI